MQRRRSNIRIKTLEKAYELEAIASTDGGDGMEPEKRELIEKSYEEQLGGFRLPLPPQQPSNDPSALPQRPEKLDERDSGLGDTTIGGGRSKVLYSI